MRMRVRQISASDPLADPDLKNVAVYSDLARRFIRARCVLANETASPSGILEITEPSAHPRNPKRATESYGATKTTRRDEHGLNSTNVHNSFLHDVRVDETQLFGRSD